MVYSLHYLFLIYTRNYTEPLIYSFFDAVPTDEHHLGLHS